MLAQNRAARYTEPKPHKNEGGRCKVGRIGTRCKYTFINLYKSRRKNSGNPYFRNPGVCIDTAACAWYNKLNLCKNDGKELARMMMQFVSCFKIHGAVFFPAVNLSVTF